MKFNKVDFKKISLKLGECGKESSKLINSSKRKIIDEISEAVNKVCNHTPWKSQCIVQAMVAQKLLSNKRIDSTVYFGITKENDELKAHAWLRSGDKFVTGGSGVGFVVVKKFSKIYIK